MFCKDNPTLFGLTFFGILASLIGFLMFMKKTYEQSLRHHVSMAAATAAAAEAGEESAAYNWQIILGLVLLVGGLILISLAVVYFLIYKIRARRDAKKLRRQIEIDKQIAIRQQSVDYVGAHGAENEAGGGLTSDNKTHAADKHRAARDELDNRGGGNLEQPRHPSLKKPTQKQRQKPTQLPYQFSVDQEDSQSPRRKNSLTTGWLSLNSIRESGEEVPDGDAELTSPQSKSVRFSGRHFQAAKCSNDGGRAAAYPPHPIASSAVNTTAGISMSDWV